VTADIKADLSSIYNWNVKQIFVWIMASYDGKEGGVQNEVSLWDKIIQNPKDAVLHLQTEDMEYALVDMHPDLANAVVNFTLNWDVHPHVGPILKTKSIPFTVTLPTSAGRH
jgi:signal peptidase complex subunit 3